MTPHSHAAFNMVNISKGKWKLIESSIKNLQGTKRGFEAIDDGSYTVTTGISFNPLVILSEIHILISLRQHNIYGKEIEWCRCYENWASWAFSSRRNNLPVVVLGIESMNTTPPFSLL